MPDLLAQIDWNSASMLAMTAINVMQPFMSAFLKKAFETAGEKSVEALFDTVAGEAGPKSVERWANDPSGHEAALAKRLERLIEENEEFASDLRAELKAALEELKQAGANLGQDEHGAITITGGVSTGDFTNIRDAEINAAGRDLFKGVFIENLTIVNTTISRPKARRLKDAEERYLRHVYNTTRYLSLEGIDPEEATDQPTRRLELRELYTGLISKSTRVENEFDEDGNIILSVRKARVENEFDEDGNIILSVRKARVENEFDEDGNIIPSVRIERFAKVYMRSYGDDDELESETWGRRLSVLEMLNDHDRLVLLGDPGSGKTTFVNFLLLCFAGATNPATGITLDTLRAPLPDDKSDEPNTELQTWVHGILFPIRTVRAPLPGDKSDKPNTELQPWDHGILFPIRIILRDFARWSGLPNGRQPATAKHILDYVKQQLTAHGCEPLHTIVADILNRPDCLLMFDGLDEVSDPELRRPQIKAAIEDLARGYQCRILVTGRTYAYQNNDWKLDGFQQTELAPFNDAQINAFVDQWYRQAGPRRGMSATDATARATRLKDEIRARWRLKKLAEQPLLLTLMASLHAFRHGDLPQKREQLYEEAVGLLLDRWERARVEKDRNTGQLVKLEDSLSEWLKLTNPDDLRHLLEKLAYEGHRDQPDGNAEDTADIPEDTLTHRLMYLGNRRDIDPNKAHLAAFLSQRSGILHERGNHVYTFPHRTFQEFLAACYLTRQYDYPTNLADHVREDPPRWREATMLAGARTWRTIPAMFWTLVEALCPAADDRRDNAAWAAMWAGQTLVENEITAPASTLQQPKIEPVRYRLLAEMRGSSFSPRERAEAGSTLAALGDPRFDPAAFHLPRITADEPLLGFVHVPGGRFLLGSNPVVDGRARDSEQPQIPWEVDDFYLARYPVTVAQWKLYLARTGTPPQDNRSTRDPDNHPVRSISWHEAVAYAAWLDGKLRQSSATPAELRSRLDAGWAVRLPSEAEWEYAARYPDNRIYPWSSAPVTPNHANYAETGLGTTSAVGCFPLGASQLGLLDLSGNVWEWTTTIWQDSYKDYANDNRLESDAWRVRRGGSFFNEARVVRAAYRDFDFPDLIYLVYGVRVAVGVRFVPAH